MNGSHMNFYELDFILKKNELIVADILTTKFLSLKKVNEVTKIIGMKIKIHLSIQAIL